MKAINTKWWLVCAAIGATTMLMYSAANKPISTPNTRVTSGLAAQTILLDDGRPIVDSPNWETHRRHMAE